MFKFVFWTPNFRCFICKVHDLTTTRSVSPSPVKVHVSSVRSFRKLFPDSHDLNAHFAVPKGKKKHHMSRNHLLVLALYWLLNTKSTPPKKKYIVLAKTGVCISSNVK